MLNRWLPLAAAVLALVLAASSCPAHPAYITEAHATIQADGTCRITLRFDVLAFALNDISARIGNEAMEALLAAPRDERERIMQDARKRFERGFAIITKPDGNPAAASPAIIHFPDADDLARWQQTGPPLLPAVIPVEASFQLPAGTQTVAFRFPGLLADVILTVERPGEDFFTEPVDGGKTSTALAVRLKAK